MTAKNSSSSEISLINKFKLKEKVDDLMQHKRSKINLEANWLLHWIEGKSLEKKRQQRLKRFEERQQGMNSHQI